FSFFFRVPRLPSSTLFPYTTLFRSRGPGSDEDRRRPQASWSRDRVPCRSAYLGPKLAGSSSRSLRRSGGRNCSRKAPSRYVFVRSEEHTSELQSRENLVCRLLLEKK